MITFKHVALCVALGFGGMWLYQASQDNALMAVGIGAVAGIVLNGLIEETLANSGMNRNAARAVELVVFCCLTAFVVIFYPNALPNALHAISDGLHEAAAAIRRSDGG
jgi:fucose permease